MTTKTHILSGLVISSCLSLKLRSFNPIFYSFSILGSIFPDMDAPRSTFNKYITRYCFIIFVFLFYYMLKLERNLFILFYLTSFILLNRSAGHRRYSHSLIASFTYYSLISYVFTGEYYSLSLYSLSFLSSYLMHLFMDTLTSGGVPLLYPYKRRFSLNLCNTGGSFDFILYRLNIVVFIILTCIIIQYTYLWLYSSIFYFYLYT